MTEADGPGLSRLLVLAQGAQVGCQVVGLDQGVGMVVTQHATTPGEGVLLEGAGPLVLAQNAQIGREPARRGEGLGMVVAPHAAEAGEGVGLELAGRLVLVQGSKGQPEETGCAQCLGVVFTEDPAAARGVVDQSAPAGAVRFFAGIDGPLTPDAWFDARSSIGSSRRRAVGRCSGGRL
jgi:hypothetical protein